MTALRVSHLSDARQISQAVNTALRKTDALALSSDQLTALFDRQISVAGPIQVNGVQVVGPRITGWVADTGTAEGTAHATYTVGSSVAYTAGATLTYSATYVQAEQTAMATRMAAVEAALAAATTRIGLIEAALQGATRGQMAVKAALIAHGLVGA